jgi:Fe-S-cluster containining protein
VTFSRHIIKELLHTSVRQRQKLKEAYALLPATRCQRKAHCCSMLPEMSLLEALTAIQRIVDMRPATRKRLIRKIIGYFFLNPVEILSCPFLDCQDCLIYQNRFFGCRAYGLWSQDYYEILVSRSHQAKKHFRKQWKNLGVHLPHSVINFHVPYCLCVELIGDTAIDDKMLLHTANEIETLSEHFSQWHESFSQRYFLDLSFLLASLAFGFTEAVQMKFALVREIIATGNRARLNKILEELPDLFPPFHHHTSNSER